ncbi:MAG: hypothetical protein M0Z79_03260 [Nitrospiraceae bacterium]|nr:hypothetical protein [Nitrospiraceae bacterium]
MNTKDYFELFRYLMEQRRLGQEDVVFVPDIRDWCREHHIPESDPERPVKLVSGNGEGCIMLVREELSEKIIEERIRALSIRGQLRSVATDRAATLDTVQKRLAFLFLREYAFSLPEVQEDDLLADEWAFGEMERLEYFRE